MFGWLPTMLTSRGLDLASASSGLAVYNFGGVLGILIWAMLIPLLGSRGPLLSGALACAVSALALIMVPIQAHGRRFADHLSRAQRFAGACDSDLDVRSSVPRLSHQHPRNRGRILGGNRSDRRAVKFGLWLLLHPTWSPLLLVGVSSCHAVHDRRACLGAESLSSDPQKHP